MDKISDDEWIALHGQEKYNLIMSCHIIEAKACLDLFKNVKRGMYPLEIAIESLEEAISDAEMTYLEHGGNMEVLGVTP